MFLNKQVISQSTHNIGKLYTALVKLSKGNIHVGKNVFNIVIKIVHYTSAMKIYVSAMADGQTTLVSINNKKFLWFFISYVKTIHYIFCFLSGIIYLSSYSISLENKQ